MTKMPVQSQVIPQEIPKAHDFAAGGGAGDGVDAAGGALESQLGGGEFGGEAFGLGSIHVTQSTRLTPPVVIEERDGLLILRDDRMPGGTKARILPAILTGSAQEYVYASPVCGYAQVALAHTCRALGKRATIFCARRGERHPLTIEAARLGARMIEVPVGYMTVVRSRARSYCEVSGARLLPFGLDTPAFLDGLAAFARSLPISPAEVWTVAGSGVLTRALQMAWPAARFYAVQVGAKPDAGRATVLRAPEKFEQTARMPPPFPSCGNYDAKAWRFIRQHARPGALFWNVAA